MRPRGSSTRPSTILPPAEFLLATKLITQRRKDAGDIRQLAELIGLADTSADEFEALIYRYYTDRGMLEFIVDGADVAGEIRLLAEQAAVCSIVAYNEPTLDSGRSAMLPRRSPLRTVQTRGLAA